MDFENEHQGLIIGRNAFSEALRSGKLLFSSSCRDTIREFSLYVWDPNSGEDRPVKQHDHAMDEIRYFVTALFREPEDDFFAFSLSR